MGLAAPAARPPVRVAANELPYPKDKAALAHFKAGVAFYNLREFEKAITEFKAGAVIEQAPILFYNLAQAYRELGDHAQAIWFYKRALTAQQPPTDWLAKRVADKIAAVEEAQRKAAEAKPVEPLRPAATTPDAPTASAPGATPVDFRDDTIPKPAPPRAKRAGRSNRRVLAWGLIGGGVVVGAASGFAAWSAIDKDKQADATRKTSERNALYDAADTRATLATVGGIIAGAAIVGGVVVLFTGRSGSERPAGPVTFVVTPNRAAVAASFSF